jgi:hypothetical protein
MSTKPSKPSFDVSTVLGNASSQFRGLNAKEPGQWPLLPKVVSWLAAAVAVVVAMLVCAAVRRRRRGWWPSVSANRR